MFLGIVENSELSVLMEDVHLDVTGMTIAERISKKKGKFREDEIDYSRYELLPMSGSMCR